MNYVWPVELRERALTYMDAEAEAAKAAADKRDLEERRKRALDSLKPR